MAPFHLKIGIPWHFSLVLLTILSPLTLIFFLEILNLLDWFRNILVFSFSFPFCLSIYHLIDLLINQSILRSSTFWCILQLYILAFILCFSFLLYFFPEFFVIPYFIFLFHVYNIFCSSSEDINNIYFLGFSSINRLFFQTYLFFLCVDFIFYREAVLTCMLITGWILILRSGTLQRCLRATHTWVGLFTFGSSVNNFWSFVLVSTSFLGNAENQLEFWLLASSKLFIAGLLSSLDTFYFTFSKN